MLECSRHRQLQFITVERLGHKVPSTSPHGLDRFLNGSVRRHQDDRHVLVSLSDGVQQLQPIHSRHGQISNHQVDFSLVQLLQSGSPI